MTIILGLVRYIQLSKSDDQHLGTGSRATSGLVNKVLRRMLKDVARSAGYVC
jgi:hypothetical protein